MTGDEVADDQQSPPTIDRRGVGAAQRIGASAHELVERRTGSAM
ncbi:MAG TPA: hypothetical protein QGI71_02350 [Dehalococcoidia bacterium]|nr:hypothetical protein [Dehalococcoidia bacterium]